MRAIKSIISAWKSFGGKGGDEAVFTGESIAGRRGDQIWFKSPDKLTNISRMTGFCASKKFFSKKHKLYGSFPYAGVTQYTFLGTYPNAIAASEALEIIMRARGIV
jgi:hypothetical protein